MKPFLLWLLVLASLAGYLAIACSIPLSPALHHPPAPDLYDFTPSLGAGLAYAALLGALFLLYGLAYRHVRQRSVSLAVILLVAAVFCLPLIATFPYNATDVYGYFIHARQLVVYGHDPFTTPPSVIPADPLVPLVGEWATVTSAYGPLWELVAAGLTLLNPHDPQRALILFKTLASALHLAIAGLVWASLAGAPPAERRGRTLLWAWNPALLLISAGNAHNDTLMLFWLILGWWLFRRHQLGGLLVMALAALTKPIALLVLPFLYVAALRQQPDLPSRLRLLVTAGAGSLALALLAFLPFAFLSGHYSRSAVGLIQRLLLEAGEAGGFSPAALLILLIRHAGADVPVRWVTGLAGLLFATFFVWLLWRAAHGRSAPRSVADALAGYLLQAFKFRIWYAAWPFLWLLLDLGGPPGRLTAGIWFLLTTQLSVLIYNHLWRLVLDRQHVWTHLIGVLFTFLLPILAALIQRRIARHE